MSKLCTRLAHRSQRSKHNPEPHEAARIPARFGLPVLSRLGMGGPPNRTPRGDSK